MILKTPLIACFALLGVGYGAFPCVTLYRLDAAMRDDDSATMARLVDWPSVRAGLQHDLAAKTGAASDELPAFGSGFRRHIAAKAVQADVTPAGVLARFRNASSPDAGLHFRYAYFGGPREFVVALGCPDGQEVRLRLELHRGEWKLTRVWVPQGMLTGGNPGQTAESG